MNDKPKELEEHSAKIFELGCMERPVYLKEDVDAVIAGLKQKLQDKCISCPVNMQEDDVVAELKEKAHKVIAEKDKKIAELKEQYKDMDVTHTVHIAKMNEYIEELEESHNMEVGRLQMKIAGLEKLVETADKFVKQKGGFTIKDITFKGV